MQRSGMERVSKFVYTLLGASEIGGAVKQSEFVRWLARQGATFKDGSRHLKVYLNGKQTTLPRHPSAELKTGLVEGVKRQLDIK